MSSDYDILIIGGGMNGASLALALAGKGLRLALVERAPLQVRKVPNYDARGIALALGSQRILSALDLWTAMASKAQPIEHIHVSEQGGFGITRLHAREEGVPALGYVISAQDLGAALLHALQRAPDLRLFAPQTVHHVSVQGDWVHARLDDGSVRARLLVAADGGQSPVRQQLGFTTRRREYGQTAIAANLTPGKAHGNVAYERFTSQGPLALLPMTEGRCALVWTVPDAEVGSLLSCSDTQFLSALQTRFGWRLGRLQKLGERRAYPLSQLFVPQPVGTRVVLIGNAAHSLHPVAGQGFNLGIRDVAVLADVVLEAHEQGEDIGAASVLARYGAWRKWDQRRVAEFSDGLVRIFSNAWGPLRLARNLGLLGLEVCPVARHGLAHMAMGLSGRLPRLARAKR